MLKDRAHFDLRYSSIAKGAAIGQKSPLTVAAMLAATPLPKR